jgi:hypothetical protein
VPYPLVGAVALRAEVPWEPGAWLPVFLKAVADEAADGLQLLMTLERAWFAARSTACGQRSASRAAIAIDVMAAAPLVSATSLGRALGMAVKNAAQLLDRFCAEGIAVELTHRSKRRLFGLAALAPLRDGVAPPRRPEPGRGRGRPPVLPAEEEIKGSPVPLPPLTPIERRSFDYGGLEAAMALADDAIRNARRNLDTLANWPPSPLSEPVLAGGDEGDKVVEVDIALPDAGIASWRDR